ncbi:T9SS type A sorting domain-containing protein [Hymenobacter weizhouensis]|uniref:T9SS type A sorting domain-containing protein n=1 Tax=Hymenobacter sp. YIM 151500-1 TaxID=2987689 RepID=UPI002227E4A6|nr:T9SS type A sorting domain-containing protein [Hymenobacter sp. YIM 151500-1]UYZ63634.1 T9SS type A sorting domain-containing protein [Hymenobacter sp. YIM 151500-1]
MAALPAQAQRDPLLWPFDKTSIWNMPLHNNAVYVPAGLKAPTSWVVTAEEDIIIMTPNAPATPVYQNWAGWDRSKSPCAREGSVLATVPIPANFFVDRAECCTPNNCAAILTSDGSTIWQGLPFYRCSGSSYATVNYASGTYNWDGVRNTLTGDGRNGSHGASAMSALGGVIRVGELRPGRRIPHALKLVIGAMYLYYNAQDATKGYRWPAYAADSYAASNYKGTVPALEMGALLALPPSVSIASLNLESEPGRIVAQALQEYGAYVVDETGGSDVFHIAFESGPAGSAGEEFRANFGYYPWQQGTGTPWARDIIKIFTKLSVVSNNDAGTIGGGPTTDFANRRAPMACDCGTPGTGLACPASLVLNGSFEQNSPTATPPGWTSYGATPAAAYTESHGGSAAGTYHLTHYNGQSGTWSVFTSQVIRNLPNGTYTVRAKARKSGSGFASAWLEAKNYSTSGSRASVNIPTAAGYQTLELPGLLVTNGQLEVGLWTDVRNGSNWPFVYLDAVELVSTGPAAPIAARSGAATTSTPGAGEAAAALNVFPNPSLDGRATLHLTAQQAQRATVQVYNQQGQFVSLLTVPLREGQTEFRLPAMLPPGTYYLKARLDGQPQQFTLRVE